MKERLYKLDDTVLSVSGNAEKFLNGLTSNLLDQHLNAFLNQHGRVIAVCFQEKKQEDLFLLSVPKIAVDGLLKHLERYAKLNHITIVPSEYKSYMDINLGRVLFLKETKESNVSAKEFTLFRLDKKFPLMGVSAKGGSPPKADQPLADASGGDFQADEFILNIDELAYVSYTKGCFLGQEPVAKVHNRSKPSRKLVVKFEDECSPEEASHMTSKVKDPTTGRVKGFVFLPNI